jgi:hypothetical protein
MFFAALAPAELDVYDRVLASLSGEREQLVTKPVKLGVSEPESLRA